MEVNIIVQNEKFHENKDLIGHLFGPDQGEIEIIEPDKNMWDILVHCGLFRSKSDARKNWKKTGQEIPLGFSQFTVGKLKTLLTIWNPK